MRTAVAPPEGVTEAMVKKYGTHRRCGLRACKAPRSTSMTKVPQSAAHHALNSLIGHELQNLSEESLLLSCVIDAKEQGQVITYDVAGAFMQVDIDKVMHIRLKGVLAKLLIKVDPELYTKYLVMERGNAELYVQLGKALYGTMSASMLYGRIFPATCWETCLFPTPMMVAS